MKGLIFTEFFEVVEEAFGVDICEEMLEQADDDGIYTSVGSYDHKKLVKMIVILSKLTKVPIETLQEVFGEKAFSALKESLPIDTDNITNTLDFIQHVESFIHVEVKKLYPDSTLPTFEFVSVTPEQLIMDYLSPRCMGHVCLGLMKGCAAHFNEDVNIDMVPVDDIGSHVRFTITRQ
ncbi:heme NO-binding domain-containing protein [uncultured Shewanella sp.]|uniref:heme NO-binding domain-containing protein n=1 Tax=uncultured Shewanella sp. TaxID=173975 RepID=UPI002609FF2C|nr:heme NO-binding domain-containing protein [uncultured Shewanella sp.]